MITAPLLNRYIRSAHYRVDLANRLGCDFSDKELTTLIVMVLRLALRHRSTVEIVDSTSRREGMITYIRAIEFLAMDNLKDSLLFGGRSERAIAIEWIRWMQPPIPTPAPIWSIDEFYEFVLACQAFDDETKRLLQQAQQAIAQRVVAHADAEYATSELHRLTRQLAEDQDSDSVKTIWSHIKEATPTIASILSAIAAIAKNIS